MLAWYQELQHSAQQAYFRVRKVVSRLLTWLGCRLRQLLTSHRYYAVIEILDRPDDLFVIDIDFQYPLPETQRRTILDAINAHPKLIRRVLSGEPTSQAAGRNYTISLVAIGDETQMARQRRLLAIYDYNSFVYAGLEANNDTLAYLLRALSHGLRDPETNLYSQAAFRRHLEGLLTSGRLTTMLGVFMVQVGAPTALPSPDTKRQVGETLADWLTPFQKDPVAMVARYDHLCYAITLPIGNQHNAIAQARAMLDTIGLMPGGDAASKCYVGITLVEAQGKLTLPVVMEAMQHTLREALNNEQGIAVQVVGAEEPQVELPGSQ